MFRSQSVRQSKPEMLRHSKSETSLASYTNRERRRSSTCAAVRIVVLGASGVGKTALTVRFLTRRFIGEYHPTLESTYRHKTTVDDDEVSMEILDTAGDAGNIYRDGQTAWAEAFILVYSITDRTSFEQIEQMWRDLRAQRPSSIVAAILVGNKNDLKHSRQVTQNDGDRLADAIGCPFYEVSAMDGQQIPLVIELFRNAVRELRMKRLECRKHSSSASQMKKAVKDFLTFRASKARLNSAS
ncbi:ras-related and estrogen-regulated growth inhibitor-like [Ptychodera flava]|uniref:ras-related and estrogen-regulated growth inhibitor-like n=1 Tax=Ptychodera flava TaxID=63121 RepID=UPI003969DCEE